MINFVIVLILAAVLGLAGYYVYRSKKKGTRCIGCPSGGCKNCPGCRE